MITTAFLAFLITNYINEVFDNITIDQLIYSIKTSEGTSSTVVIDGVCYVLPWLFVIYGIILFIIIILKSVVKTKTYLIIKIKSKDIRLLLWPLSKFIKLLFSLIVLLLSIRYVYTNFNLDNYFNPNRKTNFFDIYYTDPNNIKIEPPKEKQNLIYIYVESLETSLFSNKNGGNFKSSIIPNLEKLAQENINFSMNDKLGGAYAATGSTWTIAALVSSTSGTPLKLPSGLGNLYTGYGEFLPGVYSLGDVLNDNGYQNYLMIGSDAEFAGRKDYFKYHGNYNIKDYVYAKEKELIDEDYYVWWGYEDSKLFNFAKDELTEISKNDEPFNFTMLTADTHFSDGYVDKNCQNIYDYKYLNSYHCSDSMISDFIKWIQKQDFYKNTTIVITGDHLSMQANITDMFDENDYDRDVYNVFINAKASTKNTKNRIFTTFDFYPTTLAALGFKINGDRLGLGTNLFSDRPTLAEEIGDLEKFNIEISKNSTYYNKRLLKESYGELKKAIPSK